MTAPLIGLSTRRWPLAMLGAAIPAAYEDGFFDMGISDYPAAVAAAGGVAVHLSRDADLGFLLDHLDGLIMTGGADVSPARYGSPHPELVGPTEPERDAWEEALYRGAVDRDIPVLGICRGFQLINVINGGAWWKTWLETKATATHALTAIVTNTATRYEPLRERWQANSTVTQCRSIACTTRLCVT